ncbi:MAG: hypothetical protein HRT74_06960 [Flavobacteriales bacterium]|nr:hypothetical protein [Flavobacteriales bacterium]
MKSFFVMFSALLLSFGTMAQLRNIKDSTLVAPHLTATYGYHLPGGDLADRFGNSNALGADFYVKTKKNWFIGTEANFIFGNEVFEPGLLSNLYTDRGEVIDQDGEVSILNISQRGWSITANGGKLFRVFGSNANSGLLIRGGIGFIQHKIRIEHQVNTLPQLDGDYEKGYDRLTNGLLLKQFVGYYHMSNNRLANFVVGFEMYQGFTQGRRDFNFDTQTVDDQPRFDVLAGFKVGWVIHFYRRTGQEYYID